MEEYYDDDPVDASKAHFLTGSGSENPLNFTLTSPSSIPMVVNFTSMIFNSSGENLTTENVNRSDFELELPRELVEMSESSKHVMIAYCILFVIAVTGNFLCFISVFKQFKKNKSRISLLILHLSLADILVSLTLIPTEVFWRITIQWRGGNILCKFCQFARAFGLYLSSNILIVMSLDRFMAILFPMKMLKRQGHHRIKVMLYIAWLASAAFSTPQAILFSIVSHPEYPSFKQCVANEILQEADSVRLYSIFSVSAMYFAPLVVIIFTYTAILIKIIRKAHQNHEPIQSEEQQPPQRNRYSIRFRMSMRGQRHCESNFVESDEGASKSTTHAPHYPHQFITHSQQHNHSNKLPVPSNVPGTRRKTHTSTSSVPPDGDFSSEDGSYSGSTCSTMNVPSNNSNLTIVGPSGRLSQHNHIHHQQQSSPSPSSDVLALGRVNSHRSTLVLRRSDNAASTMSRAKNRTLVMTIVIVLCFVLCWTPYVYITLWYMFDWEGAKEVDPRVQDGLFVMAVANSCVNPLIYGSFAKNCCGLSKIFSRLRSRTRGQ